MSTPESAELPPLASLSLVDDHFRATLPAQLAYWDARDLNWKEREEQMVVNLKQQEERLAQALRRTKERWCWFVQAQTRDIEQHTSLGTLGYLPLEIRVKKYGLVFNTQVRRIPKYWGNFCWIPPWRKIVMRYEPPMWWMHFDYEACAFGCWNGKGDIPDTVLHPRNLRAIKSSQHKGYPRQRSERGYPGPLNLRTYFAEVGCVPEILRTPFISISRSLRDEFGDYMIGSRNFSFRCPASFAHFLHRLTARQIASLRRITIDLTGPEYPFGCRETVVDPEAWASTFTDLPSELVSLSEVIIMIGEDAPSFMDETGTVVAWYQDADDSIYYSLLPLYGIDTVAAILRMSSRGPPTLSSEIFLINLRLPDGEIADMFLGIVAKGIHAVAPKATLLIPEYEYLKGGNQGEGPIFYPDSDNGKITSTLMEAGISDWNCFPYRANLAYPATDETTAD